MRMGLTVSLSILILVLGNLASLELKAKESSEQAHLQSLLTEMEGTLRDIELHVSRIESTGLIDPQSLEMQELFEQFGQAATDAYQITSG